MKLETDWGALSATDMGGGPPVVLLHPLAMSRHFWLPLATELSAEYRVLAPDARGHGNSTWDGAPFTVEDMAADVALLIDHIGEPAVVIGMSMGGCVAVALAIRNPDLVRGLVLADTTASYGPGKEAVWEERATNALKPREQQLKFQHDRWFSPAFLSSNPDEVERVSQIFLSTDSQAHAAACRALGAYDDTARLGQISAPTLVLVGDEDYATPPAMAEALHTGIEASELMILEETRHLSLLQNRTVWPRLIDHLRSVTTSQDAR